MSRLQQTGNDWQRRCFDDVSRKPKPLLREHRVQPVAQGTADELKRALLGEPAMEVRLVAQLDGLLERLGTSLDIAAVGPNWFRYRTTNPEADNPAVLARLHELGQRVISLSPVERRLEEVYLRIVEQ